MSTKSKKRRSQKVVKESKPEVVKTKPVHGLAVGLHDLPTKFNDAASNPPGVPLDDKSTSTMKDKSMKQLADPSKDDVNPGSTLEDDIKWCIAQLEMAVVSKSVTKKQKEESIKYIKLLESSRTPVPRKRQIMRQNFGDYKQKMRERPLPDSDVALKVADSELLVSAGKFHRKSMKFCCVNDDQGAVSGGFQHHSDSHTLRDLCKELESTSFTFNFSID